MGNGAESLGGTGTERTKGNRAGKG